MRDASFSICKAIAIILVVLSHAAAPGWMAAFVYQFHVPVFFICAGYFFKTEYLDNEKPYIAHRFRGLYVPFVKWSLLFLCLHNVFFWTGILNERYGNAAGGVLHPYGWHDFSQRVWSCVTNMSGYDEFLCGAFWFFRAFFIASIVFLLFMKLMRWTRGFRDERGLGWGVLTLSFVLTTWLVLEGMRATGVAQGGYRELTGVFFMAVGFLYRRYREHIPGGWWMALACFAYLAAAAVWWPSAMSPRADFGGFVSLLAGGTAGFYLVYILSQKLATAGGAVARSLVYVGDRTLYIFAFHLLAFKAVSAVKVACLGRPWEQVGWHPAIPAASSWDLFFLLYVLAGVGLPLAWLAGWRAWRRRHPAPAVTPAAGARLVLAGMGRVLLLFVRLLRRLALAVARAARSLWEGFKGILEASNPRDE